MQAILAVAWLVGLTRLMRPNAQELPKPIGFGMAILETGITLTPISPVLLVVGPLYGMLMNVIGYKRLLITTSLLSTIMNIVMALLVPMRNLDLFIIAMIMSIPGTSGMMVTRITLLISSVSRERMATLTGTNTAMRLMGNTLGPVIAGSLETTFRTPILAYYLDGMPIFYEVPGRYAFIYAFIISAVTSLIVAIMATRITK